MVNAAAKYRRALKRKLRCSTDARTRLLKGFDKTLHTFLEDHTEPSMDDLTAAFGAPEEMAEVLMAETTAQEQARYQKKILLCRILACIFVVLLAVCTIYIWFLKEMGLTVVESGSIISPTPPYDFIQ